MEKHIEIRRNGEKIVRKISVIVPVYNALAKTRVCIEAVEGCFVHRPCEIIVVDNASTDGTAEYLADKDNVAVITNAEPESVAAAFNKGYRIATGEAILFMHNDTVLPPRSIDLLEKALYGDDSLGAVGPTAIGHRFWPHNLPEQVEEYVDIAGMSSSFENLQQFKFNLRPTFVLEDFCALFKREALEAVGEWDESFLLRYFEDVDYSYRMQMKGWKLAIVPNVFVHHFQMATFEANRIDHEKAWKIFSDHFKKKWNFSFEYSMGVRDDLLKYVDVKKNKVAILDIGCALGGDFCVIKEANPEAELCGIELDPATAVIARMFADVRNNNIEEGIVPEWQEKFDYVIMGDVIEHLIDPWTALKTVYDMMKPGGCIIASIPNVLNISVVYDLLQGNFTYEDAGILDRTHRRFYTRKEILKLFKTADLEPEIIGSNTIGKFEENDNEWARMARAILAIPEVTIESEDLEVFQWHVRAVK